MNQHNLLIEDVEVVSGIYEFMGFYFYDLIRRIEQSGDLQKDLDFIDSIIALHDSEILNAIEIDLIPNVLTESQDIEKIEQFFERCNPLKEIREKL